MTSVYSDEARTAARELRARLERDLAAGRFGSSSTGAHNTRAVSSRADSTTAGAAARKD